MNTQMITVDDMPERGIAVRYSMSDICPLSPDASHEERLEKGRFVSQFVGASLPLDEHYDETLMVIGAVCHPAQVVDRNSGEVQERTRTVFLCEDGKRYSSTSDAVVRFVETLLLPYYSPDGQMGMLTGVVPVLIEPQKARRGRTYALRVV